MEITIGHNPPGSVTVDLNRVDALSKLRAHVRMIRRETQAARAEVPATPDPQRTRPARTEPARTEPAQDAAPATRTSAPRTQDGGPAGPALDVRA